MQFVCSKGPSASNVSHCVRVRQLVNSFLPLRFPYVDRRGKIKPLALQYQQSEKTCYKVSNTDDGRDENIYRVTEIEE